MVIMTWNYIFYWRISWTIAIVVYDYSRKVTMKWNIFGIILMLFMSNITSKKNRFSGILRNASILLYNKTFCYIGIKVKSIGQKNNRTTSTQFNDHQLAANKTINYIIWMRDCNNENEKNEWFDHYNYLCIYNIFNRITSLKYSFYSVYITIKLYKNHICYK